MRGRHQETRAIGTIDLLLSEMPKIRKRWQA
jgi:hypothetical protein